MSRATRTEYLLGALHVSLMTEVVSRGATAMVAGLAGDRSPDLLLVPAISWLMVAGNRYQIVALLMSARSSTIFSTFPL